MSHEEKVINYVLHWRNSPDGDWHPFGVVALTARVIAAETALKSISNTEKEEPEKELHDGRIGWHG